MTTEQNVLDLGKSAAPSLEQVATPEARDEVQKAWDNFLEREKSRNPENGQFLPKNKLTDEPAEGDKPKVEPKGGDKPAAEEPDAEATKTKERATVALRRARVPDAALKGLSEKDRDQWGLELADMQDNTDRLLREKQPKEKGEVGKKAGQAADEPTTRTTDLRAASAKIAETLVLDEGGRQLLEDYGNQIRESVMAEIRPLMEGQTSNHDALSEVMAGQTRMELVSEIPELKDAKTYRKVYEKMLSLGATHADGTTSYDHLTSVAERFEACMRDAVRLTVTPKTPSKSKSNGQVDIRDIRANVKSQMAGLPYEVAVCKLLDQGYKPEQIQMILE